MGAYILCSGGSYNNIVGGGASGVNTMSGCGNNDTIAGGHSNKVGGGGTANTNDDFIGGGAANVIQFGGQDGILGGNGNVVQGFRNGAVGGNTSYVYGTNGASLGGQNGFDRSRTGYILTGCIRFAVQGDCQAGYSLFEALATGTGATRLTVDGAAAGAANCLDMPAGASVFGVGIRLQAFDATTPANSYGWVLPIGTLSRTGTAASTVSWTAGTASTLSTGTTTGVAVTAAADTTNGCLALSFTPPTRNTDTWHVTARVDDVEVQ